VLRLDPATIPPGLVPCPVAGARQCATEQLVHGLIDEGLLNDVQFMLDRAPKK
jgi:hypothetical protein